MTRALSVATYCAISLIGCALDEPDESSDSMLDDVETRIAVDPIDPIDPPTTPPPAPPEGPNVVRVPSSELDSALRIFLSGPLITVDTRGVSPVRFGTPYTECTDVNQPARDEEQAACFASFSGSALSRCLEQALLAFPVQMECFTNAPAHHSYIDFGPLLEQRGATDVLFDVDPIYLEGWYSLHRVDINYLRTDQSRPLSGSFTASNKTASIWLPLTSNSPTLIVDDAPDVEMSNMRVLLRFTNIGPGVPYSCAEGGTAPACTGGADKLVSARVSHLTPRPTFYFSRNVNNVPDWLVDQLVDVDAEIKSAAEGRLQQGLLAPGAQAAVDKLITEIAINRVRNTTHPTIRGFKRIKNTWVVSGQLVLEYDWY